MSSNLLQNRKAFLLSDQLSFTISCWFRSCMSELTDFGDLMTSVGNDGEYKDLKL